MEDARIGLYQRNLTAVQPTGWYWYDSRYTTGSADWPMLNDSTAQGIVWNAGEPNVRYSKT
jgi:hypothetical protein